MEWQPIYSWRWREINFGTWTIERFIVGWIESNPFDTSTNR